MRFKVTIHVYMEIQDGPMENHFQKLTVGPDPKSGIA